MLILSPRSNLPSLQFSPRTRLCSCPSVPRNRSWSPWTSGWALNRACASPRVYRRVRRNNATLMPFFRHCTRLSAWRTSFRSLPWCASPAWACHLRFRTTKRRSMPLRRKTAASNSLRGVRRTTQPRLKHRHNLARMCSIVAPITCRRAFYSRSSCDSCWSDRPCSILNRCLCVARNLASIHSSRLSLSWCCHRLEATRNLPLPLRPMKNPSCKRASK